MTTNVRSERVSGRQVEWHVGEAWALSCALIDGDVPEEEVAPCLRLISRHCAAAAAGLEVMWHSAQGSESR